MRLLHVLSDGLRNEYKLLTTEQDCQVNLVHPENGCFVDKLRKVSRRHKSSLNVKLVACASVVVLSFHQKCLTIITPSNKVKVRFEPRLCLVRVGIIYLG